GGESAVFMPLLPLRKRFAPNLRNHRKLVVCDGSVGFFGGLNIGEEYLGRRSKRPHWCDAHMKVEGPAVSDLQRVFIEDWDFATERLLSEREYAPNVEPAGDAALQVVSGGPDRETNPIYQIYFTAMSLARKRLLIVSPYVVPTQGIRDAILSAALRGVEVTILTQAPPPDHWVPYWAAAYLWEDFLEAGVRIFRYRSGMMHAKVILVDGAWASVGSANLDYRSLTTNFELIGVVDGEAEVAKIEERFRQELEESDELNLEEFCERSRWQRAAEVGAHLLGPLL
ncbi:MAG: phospholipase D-like domain-containing protein, partial [Planctomycetota bacterium]